MNVIDRNFSELVQEIHSLSERRALLPHPPRL